VLNLYDTATQSVKTLALREPGKVGIYLCGPTVYGPPHLGHGRATLVYDILRRYLTWSGLEVRLVSNITDIDDKIIDRANRENRAWEDITHKCENVWFEAMGKLGVLRPDEVPHATDYVDQMVSMISTLIERDAAYVTGDGVYLNVKSVPDYGLLAHQSLDDMLSGGGDREVLGASNKKNPADFALWKFSKPGEPAWSAPWGDGRPGWHSECVVMSLNFWEKVLIFIAVEQTCAFRITKMNGHRPLHWERLLRSIGCTTDLLWTSRAKRCRRVWATSPIFLIFSSITTHALTACCCCRLTIVRQCALAKTTLTHVLQHWPV
jgi:hypothetical protein